MKSKLFFLFVLAILSFSNLCSQQFEKDNVAGKQWYKGNLHTHAREGESDSTVEYVVQWYVDHGYDFLVITDHSTITIPASITTAGDTLLFLLIPGEEVIGYVNKKTELEINAFNIHKDILPLRGDIDLDVLQDCIDAVRQQNGVPMINHPNYNWRLGKDIRIESDRLEILIKTSEVGYSTEFIGSGGMLLHSTEKNPAVYELSTESNYVRAKITDTDGHCAWLQPVFIRR